MEATAPPTTNGTNDKIAPSSPSLPAQVGTPEPLPDAPGLDRDEEDGASENETPGPGCRKKSGSSRATSSNSATPKTNGQSGGQNGSASGGKSGSRRERKQKFDLKKLLNLRGTAGMAKAAMGSASGGKGEDTGVSSEPSPVTTQTRRSNRVKSSEPSYSPAKSAAATVTTNGNNDSPSTPVHHQTPATPVNPRNSKEPLLKEVDPSVMLTGKRERKRKKFWDERDNSLGGTAAAPPAKVVKRADAKRSVASATASPALVNVSSGSPAASAASMPIVSKSAKRDRRERKTSGASVISSATPRHSPIAPDENNRSSQAKENTNPPENVQSLPYLALDLEQEPEAIAKELVEGVNIPGPGLPIPIDSSSLPVGWHKRVVQREIGVTRGKWDVFIQSPFGKSFRSKIELQKFFDERKMDMKSDIFDFSLDNALKRLRQIWKQYIIVPQTKSHSAEVKARRNSANAASSSSARASVTDSNSTDASTGKQGQSGLGKENDVRRESEGKAGPVPRLAVQSETGQGLRCSVDKCRKLFRNDRLLHQHIKHYHPRVYQQSLSKLKSKATADSVCPSNENLDPPNSESKRLMESRKRKLSLGDSVGSSSGTAIDRKLQTSFSLPETDDPVTGQNKSAKRSSSFSSKSKSQRKPSLVCTNNTNISTTTEDDEVFFNTRVSRARTDSILSVGSEASALGGDDSSTPIRPTFRVSKRRQAQLNKKSAALIKAKRDEEPASDNKTGVTLGGGGGNGFDEVASSFHNTSGKSEVDGSVVGGLGSGCPSVSYPPSEMDASVVSEHLTNEEVVNCPCKRTEEDGLMIQCDICLCWQHGICLGIDDEDQVPDKHVCQICRDPPGGRPSSKFAFDQDWLKEGKLGTIPLPTSDGVVETPAANLLPQSPTSDETAFKKLSELMADLANLSKVLHSLRVKLFVASQRNNSKVFMWSSAWHETETPLEETTIHGLLPASSGGSNEIPVGLDLGHIETNNTLLEPNHECSQGSNNTTAHSQSSVSAAANGLPPTPSSSTTSETTTTHGKLIEPNSNPGPLVNGCAHSSASLDHGTEEINATTTTQSSKPCAEASMANGCSNLGDSKMEVEDGHETASTLVATESVEEISKHLENGLDIDPNLIPSVSEVQRLLPSIIQATLEAQQLDGGDGVDEGEVHHDHHSGSNVAAVSAFDCLNTVSSPHPTPLPNPIYFPQQKRIDKDESRINLLDHIEKMQTDLSEVLDKVEERLILLEASHQQSKNEEHNHVNLKNVDNQVNQLLHERNKLYSRAKCVTIMLQQDVSSARKLVKAL